MRRRNDADDDDDDDFVYMTGASQRLLKNKKNGKNTEINVQAKMKAKAKKQEVAPMDETTKKKQ